MKNLSENGHVGGIEIFFLSNGRAKIASNTAILPLPFENQTGIQVSLGISERNTEKFLDVSGTLMSGIQIPMLSYILCQLLFRIFILLPT